MYIPLIIVRFNFTDKIKSHIDHFSDTSILNKQRTHREKPSLFENEEQTTRKHSLRDTVSQSDNFIAIQNWNFNSEPGIYDSAVVFSGFVETLSERHRSCRCRGTRYETHELWEK